VTPSVNQVSTEISAFALTAIPKPVFTTSIGDLVIEKVQSVETVNGVSAGPDEKLILISVGKIGAVKLDPGNFPLDAFDKAMRNQPGGEVHISGDDGSYAVCSMAGWIAPDYKIFVMGFRIPDTAKKVQFFWPGNDPINLVLDD
jgi:hypothetical protein